MKNLFKLKNFSFALLLVSGVAVYQSSLMAMDASTAAAEPTVSDATAYARGVKARFDALIRAVEAPAGGKLKSTAKTDLQKLFAVDDVAEGSLLHIYREEITENCSWEDSTADWKENSFRKKLFSALMTVLYGAEQRGADGATIQVRGIFKWATAQIAQHLNAPTGRSLRLTTAGTDLLSRFFMALTELDGALLLPQPNVTPTMSRVEHWMAKVSDCWYVAPAPDAVPGDASAAEDATSEAGDDSDARSRHWGPDVDPEGLLCINNLGKILVENKGQIAIGNIAGGEVRVFAGPASKVIVVLDPDADVRTFERHATVGGRQLLAAGVSGHERGPQIEEVVDEADGLSRQQVEGKRAGNGLAAGGFRAQLGRYLPALVAAGGWLIFDTISNSITTPEGVLMATIAGAGVHWLSR